MITLKCWPGCYAKVVDPFAEVGRGAIVKVERLAEEVEQFGKHIFIGGDGSWVCHGYVLDDMGSVTNPTVIGDECLSPLSERPVTP